MKRIMNYRRGLLVLLVMAWVAGSAECLSETSHGGGNGGNAAEKEKYYPSVDMASWHNLTMYEKDAVLSKWSSLDPAVAEEYDVYDFVNKIVQNTDENFRVRLAAVETASEMLMRARKGLFGNLVKPYSALLENKDEKRQIRMRLCSMMARLLNKDEPQHQQYINKLAAIAKDAREHELVRGRAITALGMIGRNSDAQIILDALSDKNSVIRDSAFMGLKNILSTGDIAKMPPALIGHQTRIIADNKASPKLRALLMQALAAWFRNQLFEGKKPNGMRKIVSVANDWISKSDDPLLVSAAIEAAGMMGQKESIAPLLSALSTITGDDGASIRSQICDALGQYFEVLSKVRNKDNAQKIALALIERYLDENETLDVRMRAVFALGNMYSDAFDKSIAYDWLVDYWNPKPVPNPPRSERFYNSSLEEKIINTLVMYTDGYNFQNDYNAWYKWGKENRKALKGKR